VPHLLTTSITVARFGSAAGRLLAGLGAGQAGILAGIDVTGVGFAWRDTRYRHWW